MGNTRTNPVHSRWRQHRPRASKRRRGAGGPIGIVRLSL